MQSIHNRVVGGGIVTLARLRVQCMRHAQVDEDFNRGQP